MRSSMRTDTSRRYCRYVVGSRVYTDAAGVKAQRCSSAAELKPFDAAIINSALTVERQVSPHTGAARHRPGPA